MQHAAKMAFSIDEVPERLDDLLQRQIPEQRRALTDSHRNLSDLASYCEQHYAEAHDPASKAAALEESKQYTVQSLASVAYQINAIASTALELFHTQAVQLGYLESTIHHISQSVDIHKERVARREIGIHATTKRNPRVHKISLPQEPEKPVRYIRPNFNFDQLDAIGHGTRSYEDNQNVATTPVDVSGQRSMERTLSNRSFGQAGRHSSVHARQMPRSYSGRMGPGMPATEAPVAPVSPTAPTAPVAPPAAPTAPSVNHEMLSHDVTDGPPQSWQGPATTTRPTSVAPPPPVTVSLPQAGPPPPGPSSPPPSLDQSTFTSTSGKIPPSVQMLPPTISPPHSAPPPQASPSAPVTVGIPHPPPGPPPLIMSGNTTSSQPSVIAEQTTDIILSERSNAPPPSLTVQEPVKMLASSPLGPPVAVKPGNRKNEPMHRSSPKPTRPPPGPPSTESYTNIVKSSSPRLPRDAHGSIRTNSFRKRNEPPPQGPPPDMPPPRPPSPPPDEPEPEPEPILDEPPWAPKQFLEKVQTIYPYEQSRSDELTFDEGEIIYVLKKNADDWYEGVIAPGKRGLFPGNYVEPVAESML